MNKNHNVVLDLDQLTMWVADFFSLLDASVLPEKTLKMTIVKFFFHNFTIECILSFNYIMWIILLSWLSCLITSSAIFSHMYCHLSEYMYFYNLNKYKSFPKSWLFLEFVLHMLNAECWRPQNTQWVRVQQLMYENMIGRYVSLCHVKKRWRCRH